MKRELQLQESVVHIQSPEGVIRCCDNYSNRDKIDGIQVVNYHDIINTELADKFVGGISNVPGEELGKTYIYIKGIDKYIPNDSNVEIEFYKQQGLVFMDFIRRLGAKSFEYEFQINEGKKVSWANKFKGFFKGVDASVEAKKASAAELKTSLSLQSTWTPMEFRKTLTIDEFCSARQFFEKNKLLSNSTECKVLLNARNPQENNQQSDFSVNFTFSETLQASINVASKISYLKVANVKNEYSAQKEVNKSVSMNFKVKF